MGEGGGRHAATVGPARPGPLPGPLDLMVCYRSSTRGTQAIAVRDGTIIAASGWVHDPMVAWTALGVALRPVLIEAARVAVMTAGWQQPPG